MKVALVVRLCVLANALAVACSEPQPLYPPNAPPEIREACALTARKCTACHDSDRIVDARFSPAEWRNTVERMRQFPGSAISRADIEIILRCLRYHAGSSAVAPSPLMIAKTDLPSCRNEPRR